MTDREIQLVTGALLHDIGKVIFRSGEHKKHSISGYEYLREEKKIKNSEILNCVRYHHGDGLANADIDKQSLAYIVYIADNIAAAADRRKNDEESIGFDTAIPLESVFNILNGNHSHYHYKPITLDEAYGIAMPTEEEIKMDPSFYKRIKEGISDALEGVENCRPEFVNSLLSVMEAYLSYIPSSTAKHELADISLYDHLKLTAAISSCIYQFLNEQEVLDYRKALFINAQSFYDDRCFRLFSMDLSGIQNFIYTIHSKGALQMLRSRSFYLEILMEHMIDEILEACNLSRANLIYSGGGHCYMLLPNTSHIIKILEHKKKQFGDFFLDQFNIDLFVAMESVECSANTLKNRPEGSYASLFRELSNLLSEEKTNRYTAAQIRSLNNRKEETLLRECKVCKRSGRVDKEGMCEFCSKIRKFSGEVLFKQFFVVSLEEEDDALPLPGEKFLTAMDQDKLHQYMEDSQYYTRSYAKNAFFTGKDVTTKLWVGDYTQKGKTTEDFANEAKGIDRIAVLRADVDNLGQAFVSGFDTQYTTLSRTATFSRQLSLFFKRHINLILENGEYRLAKDGVKRNVTIVYSGGDDVFLVGSWDSVIEAAVDLYTKLKEYTLGTLTISAGIGIYAAKYPLSAAATEVAELEDQSKKYPAGKKPQKCAVTLMDSTYSWEVFLTAVVGEKLQLLEKFFQGTDERGKAFLYRLLELMRNMDDRINLARFAYVLARLEPEAGTPSEKEQYQIFSKQIYQWIQDPNERKQLITAIYIYVYLHREGEGE